MRAGEVQPAKEREAEEEEEAQPRSSEPHRTETSRGPGRLYPHILQRSSAGRRGKKC